MYVRQNAARHRKSYVRGVISCSDCNYCTYNQQEMNFHTSKKQLFLGLNQLVNDHKD